MEIYGLMADIHLHRWSSFSSTTEHGLNSRLQGLLAEIERCAVEVMHASGKQVVMAGDVFHVRGSVAPSVLNPTRDMLKHCHQEYGTTFHILAGNHDLEGRESERLGSAITALECEYVFVHNNVGWLPALNMVLVPWIESIERLKEHLEGLDGISGSPAATRSKRDLIIHAPIDTVIEGLPAQGLSPEWLAGLGFRRVFSGHYHHHKVMEGGKVISIGALGHHTWSDIKSKAGFLLVDASDDKFTWRASHLPQFVDMNDLAEIDEDDIPLAVDGNYVRMRVEADKAEQVSAAREELVAMGARGVVIQAQPKQSAREGAVAATVSSGGSLEGGIAAWLTTVLATVADPVLGSLVNAAVAEILSAPSVVEA